MQFGLACPGVGIHSNYNYINDKDNLILPWTNLRIWSYCSFAWLSLTKSILFCSIIICLSFIISMAARCSEVCGWGHDSFPAVNQNKIRIMRITAVYDSNGTGRSGSL